jgi:large subunit ribosomal protein L15
MPLIRRIPKRGFNNHFRKVYSIVNLSVLEGFETNSVVDMEVLNQKGLIKVVKGSVGLKVLGNGSLTKALTVKAAGFSAAAKEAIEKAGGKAEQI